MVSGTRKTAFALALGATVALAAACSKNDNAADSTLAATDTTMMAAPGGTAMAPAPLTDAGILAMLDAANQGEIDAGKIAESKATSAAVKSFAHDMVIAHTSMLNNTDVLAQRLGITPDATAADSISQMNQAAAAALNAAPKGAAFDSTYVAAQVAGHQYVLAFVKRAEAAAQNADLQSALTSAEPKVQAHLDRIQGIQTKLK
jgi:putative membrane protein